MKYACNFESLSPHQAKKIWKLKSEWLNRQLGSSKLYSYFDKSKTSPKSIKSFEWINKSNWSRSKKPNILSGYATPPLISFIFHRGSWHFTFTLFFPHMHASRYYLVSHIYIYIYMKMSFLMYFNFNPYTYLYCFNIEYMRGDIFLPEGISS